jgi:hypothetical protein
MFVRSITPDYCTYQVVCKFREELFFKINRKTKLTRLFSTWESRMDTGPNDKKSGKTHFIFTHAGRAIDWESTPDQAGIENSDVIMAVELMDLTQAEPVGPCAAFGKYPTQSAYTFINRMIPSLRSPK